MNKFDDNAKDTLDEWIYFLKNSEIKQGFSAKGLKEADEVLKRAHMTDEERREYQRFVEVLSDKASIAMTIEFESNLRAEQKAEPMAEKRLMESTEMAIEKMLRTTTLSIEQIAEIQHIAIEVVEGIKRRLTG